MANKRQLSEDEQILWTRFTHSIKATDRDKYKFVLPPTVRRSHQKILSNTINTKQPFIQKTFTSETSLFIQHYKLFKAQQFHTHSKEKFKFIGEKQAGLDNSTWKKLQKGEIKSESRLDLHGFTAQHAFLLLEDFLLKAYRQHIRCVEVITGVGNPSQGGGILKRELPHWLNRPYIQSIILATSYVSPTNGGAVRILLKRKR